MSLLPAFAKHHLAAKEGGYSMLLSACGFGALTAAWIVASFGTMERRRRFIGVGVVVLCFSLFGLSYARNLESAVFFSGMIGLGLILFFSTSQAVVQLSADEHSRGRVMGIWAMVLSGAVPLGNLLSGPAADLWDVPTVLRAQGIVCASAALLLYFFFRFKTKAWSPVTRSET